MNLHRTALRLLGFSVFAVGMIVVFPKSHGQIPPVDLKKSAPKYQEVVAPLSDMREGKRKVNDPDKKVAEENKQIMAKMAQWNAYRLNVAPYNGEEEPSTKETPLTEEKPISLLMTDARKWMVFPQPGKLLDDDKAIYAAEFSKAMEKELMFVLKNASKPIVRINAARMLAMTAQMPSETMADSLLAILKDENERDAVKLYACEGMREVLQHSDRIEPNKHLIRDPAKQAEIANALAAIITKQVPAAATDPEQERVVQFVRREAVRALAAFRDGVIRDRSTKVLAAPSLVLIRVAMCDSSIVPEPSLAEQIEALIGYFSQRIDRDTELSAATHSANIAVLDIIRKQLPDRDHPGRERSIPWKITGSRMVVALSTWDSNAKNLPVAMDPKQIFDLSKILTDSVFSKFEENGIGARPEAKPLNEWYSQRKLNSQVLFKNDPTSKLEWVKPQPKQ